jgi:putative ABC transport system permease protein
MPRSVRMEDGEEMARTFEALWADERRDRKRAVTLVRVFGRLMLAIGLEWLDTVRTPAPPARRKRGRRGMDGLWRVVRHGTRSLAKTPAFTWSVVLLLGLGVGSVTTIFTLFDHVVLRPLPYPMAERLVRMENGSHSFPMFEDFQRFRSVEMWAAAGRREANLTGAGRPQHLIESHVSRDFFTMFGARPVRGRLFLSDDFRTGEGVVLSYGMWQRVFGADPDVVGRDVVINGEPARVVGVLAASFVPPSALIGTTVDLFRPFQPADPGLTRRDTHTLSIAGRLRDGAALAAVASEAEALAEWRAAEFPDRYVDREGNIRPLTVATLQEATVGRVRSGLGLLLGAVTLLLLVACTNVAQLFLARGLTRIREMAVRRALGAQTSSITSQLLVESFLVAAGGTLLGVALAVFALRGFLLFNPDALPRSEAIAIDPRILTFAIGLAAATALLFGLLPALRLAGRDVLGALQQRGRASTYGRAAQRVRASLVVAQIALSLMLVTQAGSLLRSFALLHEQDLGFRTESVWTLPLTPAGVSNAEEWRLRMEAVRSSLAQAPGVRAATFGISMPLEFTGGSRCCWSNRPAVDGIESRAEVMLHPVDADYFDVLDLRFVAGTAWRRGEENAQPQPALLSEALAIEFFGSAQRAVGREIKSSLEGASFRITGVLEDNRHYGPDQPPSPAVYLPITAITWPGRAHMAVLVDRADAGLGDRLREAVWRAEPDLPVPTVRALDDWASQATARVRFESLLFSTFGIVALLLVAGGLYATLLYAVGQRRRELGIRLALGDTPTRLERRVLTQGVRIAGTGCVLGLAGAWAFGRLVESQLFGMEAADPTTTGAALTILLVVAAAASWLPARRAGATDPMEALRAE